MQYTRNKIIEYLTTTRTASAKELSRALQVTSANIRHHLGILATQGMVEVLGHEVPNGRGRPTKIFGLTLSATSHNLDSLTSALLIFLRNEMVDEKNNNWLSQLADTLIFDLDGIDPSLPQRLNKTIQWLNKHNYQARWEASATGPRLILGHCPYQAILPEHPELCQLDKEILSKLLDIPVVQSSKIERKPGGIPHCVFTS
jgi:predicted ArsR family transcriptional regulator